MWGPRADTLSPSNITPHSSGVMLARIKLKLKAGRAMDDGTGTITASSGNLGKLEAGNTMHLKGRLSAHDPTERHEAPIKQTKQL